MTLSNLDDEHLGVLHAIRDMPLASAADIRWAVHDSTEKGVYPRLSRLRHERLIDSVRLGFPDSRVQRFFLTEEGQTELQVAGATWHQPGCLTRLLRRIPAVQWLYPAAAGITDLGRFVSFQWVDGVSFDAAVRDEDGWAALSWTGSLRCEKDIANDLRTFGNHLEMLASEDPRPRPSRLCFVVPDPWQAELVLRVAGRYRLEDWVTVWCISDNTWHGTSRSLSSRGWVYQPVYNRRARSSTWPRQVEECLWSEDSNRNPAVLLRRVRPALDSALQGSCTAQGLVKRVTPALRRADGPGEAAGLLREVRDALALDGTAPEAAAIVGRLAGYLESPDSAADTVRLLRAVAEWPGMPTSMARAVLGEEPGGRRAQNRLLRLSDWGLVFRWRHRRDMRYRLTDKALRQLARFDGSNDDLVWTRIQMKRWEAGGNFETHEYGVLNVMSKFLAAGCPVAAGWRDNEPMGFSGGIVPDAMVRLSRTPFLPGWHYFEYERSASRLSGITDKLTGFDSPLRVNGWPVLVACLNKRAEQIFHDVGEQMNILMLTTTLDRLKKHGPVGNPDCWRMPEYLRWRGFLPSGQPPIIG